MAEDVKFAENVILVDVAYFNDVVKDLKRYFELQLGRPLQNIYVELIALRLSVKSLESQKKLDISGKTAFWNLASPASRIRARPLLILRISWMKIPSFV